ncbi:MAG: DNA polymerase Y family protein [Pirellulaceae bacterium]|nr:DNA polymerase Y family protein [Pirellulaceae bacterium]
MTAPKRILALQLPNWPIQRLCAAQRGLEGPRPLILHARDPRRGEAVTACNAAARACGASPGLPLAEAATLARRHGSPVLLPHDPRADLAALASLAEHGERFSPLVGWETVGRSAPLSPAQTPPADGLFFDITGIGPLFGGEEALLRALLADLTERHYAGRVAVAPTIGAAWGLSRFGPAPWPAPTDFEGALGSLPVAALRLPDETAALLGQLGIERIGQLEALPRDSLAARLGPWPLWRLDQLRGAVGETIVPHRPPPQFLAETALETPLAEARAIETLALVLLRQIARQLAERRAGAAQLQLRLDCAGGPPVVLSLQLFQPSAEPRHLADLLRMQLEQARLPGPVGRLTLAATRTAPLENRQRELFAGAAQETPRELAVLIDRLAGRLGDDAVLRPEPAADPLPERAVKYRPLTAASKKRGASPTFPCDPWQRPLTLLPQPVPLEALSVAPDGPPASLRGNGEIWKVACYFGPERIETGWWRGRSQRRDYYRVELSSGRRLWVFRRLDDGRWFLHGEFS